MNFLHLFFLPANYSLAVSAFFSYVVQKKPEMAVYSLLTPVIFLCKSAVAYKALLVNKEEASKLITVKYMYWEDLAMPVELCHSTPAPQVL